MGAWRCMHTPNTCVCACTLAHAHTNTHRIAASLTERSCFPLGQPQCLVPLRVRARVLMPSFVWSMQSALPCMHAAVLLMGCAVMWGAQ